MKKQSLFDFMSYLHKSLVHTIVQRVFVQVRRNLKFILYLHKSLVGTIAQLAFVQVRRNLKFGGLAEGWIHKQANKGCGKVGSWKGRSKIMSCGGELG